MGSGSGIGERGEEAIRFFIETRSVLVKPG
jgi:hypothetical protein